MGTIVQQGSGSGVVVRTGVGTAFGRIAAGLSETQGQTAFEVGLSRFSRFLFLVAAVLTGFIFAVNVALSRPILEALLFSLAIAVGIAPEMMPAIVTVSLSAGSRALVAKRVLVKRLVAIEDLGNIEILFTDKTGTLTEGVITFQGSLDPAGAGSDRALLLGLVCNEATVTGGNRWAGTPSTGLCGRRGRRAPDARGRDPRPTSGGPCSPSTTTVNWCPCWWPHPTAPPCWSPRAPPRSYWGGACRSLPAPERSWTDCSPRGRGWWLWPAGRRQGPTP